MVSQEKYWDVLLQRYLRLYYRCLFCSRAPIRNFLTGESICLNDDRIGEVEVFRYLGNMLDCVGGAERAVRNRISVV